MKLFTDSVVSPTIGETVPVQVAFFEKCGDKLFTAFQIVGQDHVHLQCVTCNTSHCPQDQCGTNQGG